LSQVLVAFTVEFDNEFERRMPHTTTRGPAARSRGGPWLVSLAMWANFMRFVDGQGKALGELAHLAAITNLAGLERWRYVVVEPDPTDSRPRPPRRLWVVRTTADGERARAVWRPLAGVIEERWRTRVGAEVIDALGRSLRAMIGLLDVDLPLFLPVLRYGNGMFATLPLGVGWEAERRTAGVVSPFDLSALLAQVLLAFTLELEQHSEVSMAVGVNTLRVLDETGVPVRDLPRLTGVSQEAVSGSLTWLDRSGYVVVGPDPAAGRGKAARLTAKGRQAQDAFDEELAVVERRWATRLGATAVAELRAALDPLVGGTPSAPSRLAPGLEAYPEGWRAAVPAADTWPHYPMVLHRGGFPDGS
jgi:DNA-binding MarR family transcriptional regulator